MFALMKPLLDRSARLLSNIDIAEEITSWDTNISWLIVFNSQLIMLEILPKMSSKSSSFNFQVCYGNPTLLCSSSSYHFKPLKFAFLRSQFHSKFVHSKCSHNRFNLKSVAFSWQWLCCCWPISCFRHQRTQIYLNTVIGYF